MFILGMSMVMIESLGIGMLLIKLSYTVVALFTSPVSIEVK